MQILTHPLSSVKCFFVFVTNQIVNIKSTYVSSSANDATIPSQNTAVPS